MFQEGMLICGLTDPIDLCSGEVAEVLAVHPSGILCRAVDGEIFAYFAEEFESHKLFPVGQVVRGWFGRKRWSYGLTKFPLRPLEKVEAHWPYWELRTEH